MSEAPVANQLPADRAASSKTWLGKTLLALGLLGALGTASYACASRNVVRPDGGEGTLSAGAIAPDFLAKEADGKAVRLSELRGKKVVVYFYPKDETPGCTKEACAFRDSFLKYRAADVAILGVSQDTEASHKAFQDKFHLQFPLAADENGAVTQAYGVGSTMGMSARVSFLVQKDGRIAEVFHKVDPGVHADELLAAAAKLP
jgi:thioredoxin-dependent peroxiredoxin